MKLNLGSGNIRIDGFINVDVNPRYADVVHDLRVIPYPFQDDSVESIVAHHIVEHLTVAEHLNFMNECWRILDKNGILELVFPFWNTEYTWIDPTHVRAIHPGQYTYFTRANDMGYTDKFWRIIVSTFQAGLAHQDFGIVQLQPEK
jgi:predicted SAM-dependent methyltransferase